MFTLYSQRLWYRLKRPPHWITTGPYIRLEWGRSWRPCIKGKFRKDCLRAQWIRRRRIKFSWRRVVRPLRITSVGVSWWQMAHGHDSVMSFRLLGPISWQGIFTPFRACAPISSTRGMLKPLLFIFPKLHSKDYHRFIHSTAIFFIYFFKWLKH